MPPVYNRRAAADYAIKWAMSYNPDWPSHAKDSCPDCGGDCTNFISQALYAGGWPMEVWRPGHGGWYSYPDRPDTLPGLNLIAKKVFPKTSHSWAGAQPFADYLLRSGRAVRCARQELELGDVVQVRAPTNTIRHTAMVTKVGWADPVPVPKVIEDATGRSFKPVPTRKILFISCHSLNRLNEPFDEWERERVIKVGASIIYWHILDSIKVHIYPP
jgi:hypothetical protein